MSRPKLALEAIARLQKALSNAVALGTKTAIDAYLDALKLELEAAHNEGHECAVDWLLQHAVKIDVSTLGALAQKDRVKN